MRLATFNVFSGRSLADGQVVPARLTEAVRAIDADVLGMQEVDRDQPRSGGVDMTAAVAVAMGVPDGQWRFEPALLGTPGERWTAVPDGAGPAAGPAYGVGLLSRLPVLDWHAVRLASAPVASPVLVPSERREGRPRALWLPDEPRVALAAVLATAVGALTVATTHLSFVPGWNVVQLRRLLGALRELPQPVVLLGDLNLPGPVARIAAPGWRPLARVATWPATRPRVQFDHVLGHGDLPAVQAVSTPELPVSDHRAVVVQFAG